MPLAPLPLQLPLPLEEDPGDWLIQAPHPAARKGGPVTWPRSCSRLEWFCRPQQRSAKVNGKKTQPSTKSRVMPVQVLRGRKGSRGLRAGRGQALVPLASGHTLLHVSLSLSSSFCSEQSKAAGLVWEIKNEERKRKIIVYSNGFHPFFAVTQKRGFYFMTQHTQTHTRLNFLTIHFVF